VKHTRLFSLILLMTWTAAQVQAVGPASGGRVSSQRPSIIEVPLTIPLSPLFDEVEALTPGQAGHWRGWQSHKGVDTQYRAWRGPLMIRAVGDTLVVQAHVRYWVKAKASLLGAVTVTGSCGVDEPPRQALIGAAVRLDWGPDWGLRPGFRVLPTRFLDACEMTLADVDVTPLVDRAFEKELRRSILQALEARRDALGEMRRRASRIWARLQEPIEVASGVWMSLRPFAVAAAPPEGRGDEAVARLGIALSPKLHYGAKPAADAAPLPPLGRLPPGAGGLSLDVSLDPDWSALSRLMSGALQGRVFDLAGRRLRVAGLELSGKDSEVVARVRLEGEGAGEVELWAKPVLEPGTPPLRLTDLEYLYHADDPLTEVVAESFYEQVRDALLEAANGLIAQRLEQLQVAVRDSLLPALSDTFTLGMGGLHLVRGAVRVDNAGLGVSATAAGELRLDAVTE